MLRYEWWERSRRVKKQSKWSKAPAWWRKSCQETRFSLPFKGFCLLAAFYCSEAGCSVRACPLCSQQSSRIITRCLNWSASPGGQAASTVRFSCHYVSLSAGPDSSRVMFSRRANTSYLQDFKQSCVWVPRWSSLKSWTRLTSFYFILAVPIKKTIWMRWISNNEADKFFLVISQSHSKQLGVFYCLSETVSWWKPIFAHSDGPPRITCSRWPASVTWWWTWETSELIFIEAAVHVLWRSTIPFTFCCSNTSQIWDLFDVLQFKQGI